MELEEEATGTDGTIDQFEITEPPSYESLLDDVANYAYSTATIQSTQPVNASSVASPEQENFDITNSGPQAIIREMDDNTNGSDNNGRSIDLTDGLRRRRHINIEESISPNNSPITTSSPLTSNNDNSDNTDNCTNENNENGNVFDEILPTVPRSISIIEPQENTIRNCLSLPKENEFRIKLKYLNDDLKLTSGKPSEAIGDFKK